MREYDGNIISRNGSFRLNHQLYVDLMSIPDERAFDLVVNYWYYRNLKIVQNINKSLKADTKRAIVLCGGAHNI